jgi:crossover junction endodeoxyribonuclease RuvC
MQRKRALKPRNTLDARLWARLRELKEQGWHFRKGAPFKTFTLDFVEHEARLVIDLLDGEPGIDKAAIHIVRDRLLAEQGYGILRLWRVEAERDLHSALHKIHAVLDALSLSDSR